MSGHKDSSKKQVTRRDFLKGFSGGALGAAVAPKLLLQEEIPTPSGSVPVFAGKSITLHVNERTYSLKVESRETLLDVLRDRLNLTGSKRICDRGECGGCTVLLEGRPIYACMYLAIRADGAKIATIEGLAKDEELHPLQQAFIDADAYQCGFCTPGFIMSAKAFLEKNPSPDLPQIQQALSGNLCRCGNYQHIYRAVAQAAETGRRS